MNVGPSTSVLIGGVFLLSSSSSCLNRHQDRSTLGVEQTLEHVHQSWEAVRTISAECRIELFRRGSGSVQLEGAIVARLPDHLRIRAWKLSNAVFDLTVTPEGVWLLQGTAEDAPHGPAQAFSGERIAEAWALFARGPSGDEWTVEKATRSILKLSRSFESTTLTCEIDRDLQTVRGYRLIDASKRELMSIRLENYRTVRGVAWPMRIQMRSGEGRITIQFMEPDINDDPTAAAFIPPARSEKLR